MNGKAQSDGQLKAGASRVRRSEGMTLVEVMVAIALVGLMCGGLFTLGLNVRSRSETNRIATEARALAKQRLEEMIGAGRANLAKSSCTLFNVDTNFSSLGYPVVRTPIVVWHSSGGAITTATDAVYAEVHVAVTYKSPSYKKNFTDTYSMVIAE